MGANRQQGWSLLLFLSGFTFLVAGLFALGMVFTAAGVAALVASAIWSYRIKPLEHWDSGTPAEVDAAAESHRAVGATALGRR